MFENSFQKPQKQESPNESQKQKLEDSLESNVEEIYLQNFEVPDLNKLQETSLKIEDIKSRNPEISEKFDEKVKQFLNNIPDSAYSEDDLEKTALINLLRGTEIPENAEHVDLEGEYSVQDFLQEITNELNEGTF